MAKQETKKATNEPIAIVGTGCRFPGDSTSPSKLWELLREPYDVLREIPPERFNTAGFYHPDNMHHGTTNVRDSYLLSEDVRVFDTEFFGIKPIEANSIDPQQRLLMETVYESLEAAGLSVAQLQGSQTAVYVGLMCGDYDGLLGQDQENMPTYFATGTARSIISNRVSYFFDWHGPSMTIDTACSSSLVAVHQAVQLLRSGDGTEVAIAAGANLLLTPGQYIAESKLQMLSPDGRSRMWDDKANGYARGDGFAAVVLKRLSQAIKDGDHIECVIRETQTNQDGRTKGITMPSATAQAALIRATYKKAGLDISRKSDRPQYFEAHGTGTPAGDPIEAEAIHTAFFGGREVEEDAGEKLYVGSIKTVIGHTEGTAGLAALVKVSLALQNKTIPANLLLNNLNPKIKPFYGHVQIPTTSKPWPQIETGGARRASVNSFGFGGSNAHAILEAYEPDKQEYVKSPLFTSVNLSASSESSLRAILRKYAQFLKNDTSINLRDLSWTLNARRSTLRFRTSVYGATAEELGRRLQSRAEVDQKSLFTLPSKSITGKPRMLGVFTGQGAQWARMGAELLATSPRAVSILNNLEQSLAELPDRPTWSIKAEILAEGNTSRVGEAAISQPLCTAIQVLLVDLLRSAGIQFEAVVGHSSGEISCAYAAGYISARDAIRIAYYRGYHLHRAGGPSGEQGSMMAAGTSFDDATDLCNLRSLRGQIGIAASNSATSITLSGNTNAINAAKEILEDENKFARLLKVDKAYHSFHMHPCSDAYEKSLVDCKIQVRRPPRSGTAWISSVYGEDIVKHREILKAKYWIENMVSPVLFSSALESAGAEHGPFDMTIECGPHPALKGPALQVLQEVLGDKIPYAGVLSRGKNDNQAFAEGLGYIWQTLGDNIVDWLSVDNFASDTAASEPKLLSNLPTYAWDHDRVFWHESRQTAANRTKSDPSHQLLGIKCPDGTEKQLRWRNMLRPKEISWIAGHQVQGQMVLPAAAYISCALEAIKLVTEGQPMKIIEIEDFAIGQAIVFNDEYASLEMQFSLTDIVTDSEHLSASFSIHSGSSKNPTRLDLNGSGTISAVFGEHQENILPSSPEVEVNLIGVDSDRFYNSMSGLGFGYSGPFRALNSLKRKVGHSTGQIKNPPSSDPAYNFLLHPATLDAAIQSIILADCYPGDGRLWSVHLPTSIKRIKVNPGLCELSAGKDVNLHFRAAVTSKQTAEIEGDVDLYDQEGKRAVFQLEGLHTKPLTNATSANDSPLFSRVVWEADTPCRELAASKRPNLHSQSALSFDVERVAYYYLRHLNKVATAADRENADWHHKIFFEYIDHTLATVQDGTARFSQKSWSDDSLEMIQSILAQYPDSIDMKLMRAVGEQLLPVIRGETSMLEYMIEDNMLNEFYVGGVGFEEYTDCLADQVSNFGHRFPRMNVLEVGAGTGGATKRIFKQLGQKFGSYTYTDISTGFFEKAEEVFHQYKSRMTFKALNVEKDPEEQGFIPHSYDLVVASLVLHATKDLEATMRNVRRLLKPGGILVLLEFTDHEQMRFGLIFGSLPGWWMGYNDGRKLSPCISQEEWDTCLKRTGFSGVDTIIPRQPDLPISHAVILGQAVDDRISFLRAPLAPTNLDIMIPSLTIIGGTTQFVANLAEQCRATLRPFYDIINVAKSLTGLDTADIPFMGTVLSLTDLDEPIFRDMTIEKLKGAQELFKQCKSCLWVTQGSRYENPFQNMSIGFGRTVNLEMPHLRLQFVDFCRPEDPTVDRISAKLLQFEASEIWEQNSMGTTSILWTVEPELAYENGDFLIPRLMLHPDRNERYNSSRRFITKELDPSTSNLGLRLSSGSYEVCEGPIMQEVASAGTIECQVIHSSIKAIKVTSIDYAYLFYGRNVKTREQIFALSPNRNSIVRIPESCSLATHMNTDDALYFLPILESYLTALVTLSGLSSKGDLVLLEPDEMFASALSDLAKERGHNVISITTKSHAHASSWVTVHPNAPRRLLKSVLPENVSCFIKALRYERIASDIVDCLPLGCKVLDFEFLASENATAESVSSTAFISSALYCAWAKSHHSIRNTLAIPPSCMSASDVSPENQPTKDTKVFTWLNRTSAVPVRIFPVDSKPLFSPNNTYWLVGLTGGLGLSLCEWMVKHGARYIVITSRNPNVDPRFVERLEAQGVVIRICPNDITNRESVRALYEEITNELPPIAGVAQGAMVLADTMFVDVDIQRVQKVLGPKVNGSIYLEELFSETKLEFFIFFSSMAYISGNQGQSIYAAANAFMSSLATQRKKRGLGGSVIHIGTIIGNGYVTRELTLVQQEFLWKVGNLYMSENDLHQIFAEGILAGRPDSDEIPEIMTGIRPAHTDDDYKVTWFYNPRFSHCVLPPEGGAATTVIAGRTVSIKDQFLAATTPDEVREIVEDALVTKLKSTLQMDQALSILDKHTDELGIDSLVAVDIRSWFIKELNIEIPVLKILGGSTVDELVLEARDKVPASLVPNLGKEIDPAIKAAAKAKYQPSPVVAENQPVLHASSSDEYDALGEESAAVQAISNVQSYETSNASSPPSHSPVSEAIPNSVHSTFSKSKEIAFDLDSSDGSSSGTDPGSGSDTLRKSMLSTGVSTATSVSHDYASLSKFEDAVLDRSVPMSFGQSRFWFLKLYLSDQTTFNITTSIRMSGKLRIDDFKAAVTKVGYRHEGLRTSFFVDQHDQLMQGILRESTLQLEHRRITDKSEVLLEYNRIKSHTYDIGHGETMNITLLSLSDAEHQLIIGYHHINMDGVSLEILLADLQQYYEGAEILPVSIQYPDFSIKQYKEHSSGQWQKDIEFWKSEFAEIPPPLPILPISTKTARSSLTEYAFHTSRFRVDAAISSQIQNACKKTMTSSFNFYLATFKALLFRHAGDETADICIGMADGGRNNDDVTNTMGFFLNLLPLKFKHQASQTFNDALREARSKVVAALARSKVPFDVLLNEINVSRSSTYNPLFQAFINYRQGVSDKRFYCGCESEATQFDGSQTAYDISIDILDNPGGEVLVVLEGQSAIYSQFDVDILAQSYFNLLKSFARFPASRLSRPSLYDTASLGDFTAGKGPFQSRQWPETLVHRIDEIVEQYPSNVALKSGHSKLTYSQLSQRINSISATLVSNGVKKGACVGVLQDPTLDLYCSFLAVLRIGATFVPLEPRLTNSRLITIARSCSPDAIIFDNANLKSVSVLGSAFRKINIGSIPTKSSKLIPNQAEATSRAVILYTSGSTGVPKGISFTHSAWQNQIEVSTQAWQAQPSGVHLQQSSWSFDIAISQTLLALSNGATLVVVSKEKRGDPLAISKLIVSEGVTFTQATPWEYVSWLNYGDTGSLRESKWQLAMTGGESMTLSLLKEFKNLAKDNLKLFNAYGPAETTLAVGSVEINYQLEDNLEKPLSILPNYSVYILDAEMRPVPMGVSGEIYIGGSGVAEGYLNDSALTDDNFLPDDFAAPEFLAHSWLRMHKSGDRGRLSRGGGLILQGRIDGDTQVKLRGIRIELRDIESTITKHSNGIVKDAVASLRDSGTPGSEFLVVHAVLSSSFTGNQTTTIEELRLSLPLPQYMRPSLMVLLEHLPTNHSGKIDRKAIANLPLQQAPSKTRPSDPPNSPQSQLQQLWQQVLGANISQQYHIELDSNFFHVGGSSMGLVKLQGLVKKTFNVEIPLVKLFEHSTLGSMLKQIYPVTERILTDGANLVPEEAVSESSISGEAINWETETALTDELYELELDSSPKEIDIQFKTVVLTGSSGFLGKALLSRLVQDKGIEKIHAIAVRKSMAELPTIFSNPKIEIHTGDLASPRLGLSEDTARAIFSTADAVIHNGADVSFLKTYRTLAKPNVHSTRELVKLCLPHQVALHFVSSASVAHLSGQESFGEESISEYKPPTDGSDAYTATKWASERFLELVAEKFSMSIRIHRPSSVTGVDAPSLDLMTNLLSYSKKLRKVPTSPSWSGTFDFVSVDRAALLIVDELRYDENGAIKYIYQSGDLEIPVGDMKGSLERETGQVFQALSVKTWTQEAVSAGMSELVAAYLSGSTEVPILFPRLVKVNPGVEAVPRQVLQDASSSYFKRLLPRWFRSQ